ncbi:PRELI domain-containing protein 2-like [Dendronephthya gigantea]|uniref:PRELI domain-containing protein 2-like n=1 Tax=Dendronephthya gigantea TaxID=151771 RepID=UPI00106BDC71|nr:PRELI domain-containing protein 2-like [Dendronephthya gigantea]
MVKVLSFNYIFKYSFDLVTQVYFKKYTSGYDKNVEEVWVVEENKDIEHNVDYIKRKGKCANIIPWSLQMFFCEPAIYFEEEIWFNRNEKKMTMYTRNVSFTELATLEERSVYKVSDEDDRWTTFEQEGTITVNGIGWFNSFAEKCAATVFSYGANKGFGIMEELLKKLENEES